MDKMGWMGCLYLSYKGHNAFFLLILALSERDAEGEVPHPRPVDVTPIPLRKIKVTQKKAKCIRGTMDGDGCPEKIDRAVGLEEINLRSIAHF